MPPGPGAEHLALLRIPEIAAEDGASKGKGAGRGKGEKPSGNGCVKGSIRLEHRIPMCLTSTKPAKSVLEEGVFPQDARDNQTLRKKRRP